MKLFFLPAFLCFLLASCKEKSAPAITVLTPSPALEFKNGTLLYNNNPFTGNTEDYYNPANSYLPTVLETKRGLPITLSLVYRLVAERVGLRSWGVGLPGHFVVAVEALGADAQPASRTTEPMMARPPSTIFLEEMDTVNFLT